MKSLRKFRVNPLGLVAILAIAVFSVYAAVRPEDVGVDTAVYLEYFRDARREFGFGLRNLEPGFSLFASLMAAQSSSELYFFVLAVITCVLISGLGVIGPTKFFAALFFAWLCYPLFYSITLNVLRQGVAFGLMFSLIILSQKSKVRSIASVALVASFHYASVPFSLLAAIARRVSLSRAFGFWIFSVGVGFFLGEYLSGWLTVIADFALTGQAEYYSAYFGSGQSEYRTGFRPDFFGFSLVGVAFAYILKKKESSEGEFIVGEMTASSLGSSYLLMNGLAYYFVSVPYSDRFFAWSWYLYPVFCVALAKRFNFLRIFSLGALLVGFLMAASYFS